MAILRWSCKVVTVYRYCDVGLSGFVVVFLLHKITDSAATSWAGKVGAGPGAAASVGSRGPDPLTSNRMTHENCANPSFIVF